MRRQGSMPVRTLSLTLTHMAAGVVVVGEVAPGGAAVLLQPARDVCLTSHDMVARGGQGPCACGAVSAGRRAGVAACEVATWLGLAASHAAWEWRAIVLGLSASHGNADE